MVIKINQTNVVNGNVTPGDTPGFPLTLTKPGSYVLTSNLNVPDGKDAIVIAASHVTIDLNGFSILGKSSQNGPHSGLVSAAASYGYITIKDGHMTGDGIGLSGENCRVENVDVDGFNGGVVLGKGARISASVLRMGIGLMKAGDGSTVQGNSVSGGDQNSIMVGDNSIVSKNTIFQGGATVIATGDGCLVTGNVVKGGGEGIHVGFGSTVTGNLILLRFDGHPINEG